MDKKDSRRFPRADTRWPVTLMSSQTIIEGRLENVSPGGAFISCDDMPPVDGNFLILMEAPNHKPMNIRAKITWSTVLETNKGESLFGLGVQFTHMSMNDRRFLYKVIAKHYELKTSRRAGP